jgi:hypothetical protein
MQVLRATRPKVSVLRGPSRKSLISRRNRHFRRSGSNPCGYETFPRCAPRISDQPAMLLRRAGEPTRQPPTAFLSRRIRQSRTHPNGDGCGDSVARSSNCDVLRCGGIFPISLDHHDHHPSVRTRTNRGVGRPVCVRGNLHNRCAGSAWSQLKRAAKSRHHANSQPLGRPRRRTRKQQENRCEL